ncbi:MAG: reverse transcriptase-like protein [Actinomycetota bacterium]
MTRRLVVEADGGSRGNPGPAGFGAVVRDASTGEVLDEVAAAIGTVTNNVAEYSALIAGLRAAAEIDPSAAVEVRMDSKLVVEQMSGRWQIKHDDMRRLAQQARGVLPAEQVTYAWVPRDRNAHADRLANAAMDAAARGERWTRESRHGDTVPGHDAAASGVPSGGPPVQVADEGAYAGRVSEQAPLRYRLLTGTDDREFCEKVSRALAEGYRLHGGPALAFDGTRVVTAQAVVLDTPEASTWATRAT